MIGISGAGHEPSFLAGSGGTLLVPDTARGTIIAGAYFYNSGILEGDSLPPLEMDIGDSLTKVP